MGDVRGKGLMVAVELVKDRETKKPATDWRSRIIKKAFEKGDVDKFGELLDYHWNIKKNLSKNVTNTYIDDCYMHGIKNGALGGKIMGAGGGGFFMFYHIGNNAEKTKFIKKMTKKGLRKMSYNFDYEGSKIIFNMKNI